MAIRGLGLWVGALIVLEAGTAQAYCRTRTAASSASSCPEDCQELGVPIAWRTPHLTYAFNEKGFPGIEDADLRSMVAQSFSTWEHAKCDGKSVGLHSTAARETTSLTVGPKENEPNTNVIVHFDPAEWSAHEMSPQAFAITAVWFSDAGVILGADMMFNGRMDPFGACSDDGCVATDPHVDLRNVATHEFGHFLGLEHSAVADSTMWCNAAPGEVSKRSLAPDDIAGLCATYPPGEAFSSSDDDDSCALGTHANAPWSALAIALLMLWRRRVALRRAAARPLLRA